MVLFKIQGLTLNESYSLVWVQQTLFLEHTLNQFRNKWNRGSKIEFATVFRLRNILSPGLVTIQLVSCVLGFLLSNMIWSKNKSWSLSGVLQTLFLDQDLIQLLSVSYSGLKFEWSAVLTPEIFLKSPISSSVMESLWIFIFQIHIITQLDSLIRVEVHSVLQTTK